jgi:N-acetylmuramoyl-L-alanine amidase
MVKIIQKLVSNNKYSIKCPYEMNAEYITVHNTANDASAKNEVEYMINNNNEVSFHLAVDDKEAIQGIPFDRNAWHCGDGNGTGNRKSIGIEICYSKSGGDRFIKAEQNAAKLIAELLKERGWGIDRVKKHQDWSGKYCPHRTMDLGWERFLNMIKEKMGESTKPVTPPKPVTPAVSNKSVNVFYKVKTQKHGWLSEVKNLEDYAGWENSPITGVAIKVDKGSVKYRVHVKGGQWLPYVTGYNINNSMNGWAGNNLAIDLIEVYYNTPGNIRPYKKAKYKVNNYDWQYDNETKNGQDGYAGAKNVAATKFQIVIE